MKKFTILTLIALLMLAGVTAAGPGWRDRGSGYGPGQNPRMGGQFDGTGPHPMMGYCRDGRGMRGGGRGPAMILAMADEIGLTDDQQNKLKKMTVAFQTEMVDLQGAVKKAQIKKRALIRDRADENEVGSAIDDLSRLRADLQKASYGHRQAIRAVLTSEQLDKLDDMCKIRKGAGIRGHPGMKGHQGKMGWGQSWFFDDDSDDDSYDDDN
ncbi:MAG: Spy/CpxP family protein refolding chaperone [candidate division Zixibacteria bacterium]|nr:Spy/CpxP family protein refolding chaperone [candidate division Zixibacteria bacterium]